ncbi:hypothetical protein B0H16DRAFT_1752561 [Mycena metata]|nr:hypothetical protein B0H16DRAFT_1752561 [Mycena metata]
MSMTNTATFFRATTPGANAQLGMPSSDASDSASAALRRHTSLQGASTVEELIAMVPSDYRDVLTEPLRGISQLTSKLAGCRSTLAKWEQHLAAGTYPPHLRQKAPEIQLTKEFGSQGAAVDSVSTLISSHQKWLREALAQSIQTKQGEVAFLDDALSPAKLLAELQPLIELRGSEIITRMKVPVFGPDAQGQTILLHWQDNPAAKALGMQVLEDAVVYAFRVISITESLVIKSELKFHKKKALSVQADVEMADVTKAGPSMQSLIDKAVSAAFKKAKPSGKGKGNKDGKKTKPSSSKKPAAKPGNNPKARQGQRPANAKAAGKPSQGSKGKSKKT